MVQFHTTDKSGSLEDISTQSEEDMLRYFEEAVKKKHHHSDGRPVKLEVKDASEIEESVKPVKHSAKQAIGKDYDSVRQVAAQVNDYGQQGSLHNPTTFVFGCTSCGEMFQAQDTAMGVQVYELDKLPDTTAKDYAMTQDVNLYAKTSAVPTSESGQYDGNAKAKGYGGSYEQKSMY